MLPFRREGALRGADAGGFRRRRGLPLRPRAHAHPPAPRRERREAWHRPAPQPRPRPGERAPPRRPAAARGLQRSRRRRPPRRFPGQPRHRPPGHAGPAPARLRPGPPARMRSGLARRLPRDHRTAPAPRPRARRSHRLTMDKLRILIIDDERPARRAIRSLLDKEPDVEVVGEAADGEEALGKIRSLHPQIVFLDIQMPLLTGLEMLHKLPPARRPEIIFITAYDEFALRAFDLQAVDYLMKPFSDERFRSALDRARRRVRSGSLTSTEKALRALLEHLQKPNVARPQGKPASGVDFTRLVVKADGQLHFLNQADIRWVEGQGDFVKIHLKERGLMVRMTLTKIEEMLDPETFVRIHKSTIVNLNRVRRILPMLARSHGMELDDGTALPIGPSYRGVLDRLK
ncbi:MAG: hypothetical protein C0502_06940 [Opitutus sp.]|nr:hypothetical protein [Opitutus sp.]